MTRALAALIFELGFVGVMAVALQDDAMVALDIERERLGLVDYSAGNER